MRYVIRTEPGVQTPEETLELGSGSCRDSSWLLVHVLRQLGLAARFVSGYLIQLRPDQPRDQRRAARRRREDFCDLHAWCECFVPGAGWIGLDPDLGPARGRRAHSARVRARIRLSAAPIEGRVEQGRDRIRVRDAVKRLDERPRVTLPYSSAELAAHSRARRRGRPARSSRRTRA